jgi:hypothetical protein
MLAQSIVGCHQDRLDGLDGDLKDDLKDSSVATAGAAEISN